MIDLIFGSRRRMLATVLFLAAAIPNAFAFAPSLIDALRDGNREAVDRLIGETSEVTATEADGSTPLHWAIELGQTDVAKKLITAGADVNAATRFNVTPLHLAALHGNAEVIQALVDAGVDPNSTALEGETALMTAALNGSTDALRALLRNGANVNDREPEHGQTALMWAAGKGNSDAIKLLIEYGAPVSAESSGGYSALMLAVLNDRMDAVETLLDLGANIEDSIPDGTTALNVAILNGHYDLASMLLDRGADPNAKDARGSALHSVIFMRKPGSSWEAAGLGQEPVPVPRPMGEVNGLALARKLIEHGADVNKRIDWKEMHMTKSLGTTRNPPNINLGRHHLSLVGATPFYSAARNGDINMMHLLVESGADPNINTEVGVTPLMASTCLDYYEGESPGPTTGVPEAERLEAVKYAVELGNDVNAHTHLGDYPMIGSAEFTLLTYPENMDDLLDLGVGDPRWDGMAAIHGAVICNQPSILKYLLEAGADPESENRLGWTPLMITQGIFMANSKKEFPVAAEMLREAIAEKHAGN